MYSTADAGASAVDYNSLNRFIVSDRSYTAEQEIAHKQRGWLGSNNRWGGGWGPVSKGGQGAGAHPARVCAHEDSQQ